MSRRGEDALKQEVSMKKLAALIAVVAAVGLAPRHASAQTVITCESPNGRKEVCPVNTAGGVTLYRQLSSTACVQGRNWNINPSVIWVSGGCRAQFMVGNGRGGRYSNGGYNNGGSNNGGYNNGGYNNNRAANNTEGLCRRAVRQQVGRGVDVSTWAINNSRNNARVGWRIANGRSGECRIDRNGNVSVLANRGR
jgi:hypothetical protein